MHDATRSLLLKEAGRDSARADALERQAEDLLEQAAQIESEAKQHRDRAAALRADVDKHEPYRGPAAVVVGDRGVIFDPRAFRF